jgi:hypothetical protein
MLTTQRDVVERVFEIGRADPAAVELTRSPSFKALEIEEATIAASIDRILTTQSDELPPDTAGPLEEARDETRRAADHLARENAVAASPPAVRALAALTKIFNKSKPKDSPENASGQGSPSGQSAQAGESKNLGSGSGEITELYEKTVANSQRLQTQGNTVPVPPPPGPGATVQVVDDYAGLLSQRINGLIGFTTIATRDAKRTQVLTTGKPSEAPPAYRPAVADYFEALAQDRPTPAPRQP